jgi:hypothetical protein
VRVSVVNDKAAPLRSPSWLAIVSLPLFKLNIRTVSGESIMSETERAFVLVLTFVGFLACYASETNLPEKLFLTTGPLLMWLMWRKVIRLLRKH